MDRLQKEVLSEYQDVILESADRDDVFLDHLLDRLIPRHCIQTQQREVIKRQTVARSRCSKLLEFLQLGGPRAFDELCNALESFGIEHKNDLATLMRQSLKQRRERARDTSKSS